MNDEYPRVRNLPARERGPFRKWLEEWRCTCPAMDGVPREEQDCYYPWDYYRWKAQRPPIDETDFGPQRLLSAEEAAAWTQALRPELSDMRELLRHVFTTDAAIDEWLDTPDHSLEWLSPREMASQPAGLQRVRDLVVRMIHGIR